MLNRVGLAVIVGIVTWVLVALAGLLVTKYIDGDIGHFIANVSVLFGLLAGFWFFFSGRTTIV